MILLASFISLICLPLSQAQTKVIVKPRTQYPTQRYSAPSTPSQKPAAIQSTVQVQPTPTPAAEKKLPLKIVYFGEYVGPRLSNFDLSQTQGPDSDTSAYSAWFNSLKLGYAVSKRVVLGTSIRADLLIDPNRTESMHFYDMRFYGSWSHMIENSLLDMQQVVEVEAPTTNSSRLKGKIIQFNIRNNWVIKTPLRNWFFSFQTYISPRFYNTLEGSSTDLVLGFFPWITMDIAPDFQFLAEGSFDAGHTYDENFFTFNFGDYDYMDLGILWSVNAHVQLNPSLRFYMADLSPSKANFYFSLTAVL